MSKLLEKECLLQGLRSLSFVQLQELAGEIRHQLIETVAKNGGHLAPNLGVVELTLALHLVFNFSVDKIVWDVGHQSYVHKLLTGRKTQFDTLRQYGGISGFPRPEESVYDVFGTGHSSTSISAALGLAVARDLNMEKYSVVAVIGDGAMTGGMAFEALNHAGHLKKDLIVILNDNEMSIARNVGALARYLTRLRTNPKYYKGKEEFEQLLRKIPAGSILFRVAERLKGSFKYLVIPGVFFEEMGFIYLGPIDGHNLKAMISVFQQVKSIKGPVLVHVVTKKGKGYKFAESCPDRFHGIGPFDAGTGKVMEDHEAPPSYTEVFGRTIVKLAERDERVVAITAAMAGGTGLGRFASLFPRRFFDVGIAEQHAVTMAAGLAAGGYRPVVAVYSTFLQRAYDQILHDVCLQRLPVVFAIDRAGIVGEDGATHQGLFDFAYLRHIPNMVVMAPKDEDELQHMLASALSYDGPVAVRYPRRRGVGCLLKDNFDVLPFGRAEVLRDGDDVALLAVGSMVGVAQEAAELLETEGIKTAVINARFVKPLDEECILSYAVRTGRLFIIEEHVLQGGFGSAVLEMLADKGLTGILVKRLGVPDTFVQHGAQQILLTEYGLTAENLARTVLNSCPAKKRLNKLKREVGTRW